MRVSVIATAKNEEPSIGGLLHSLLAQSRQPDEVVLADGGSVDRTRAIATSYGERGLPLRLLDAPGANISRGRNLAVAAASGDIIACVDAGVRLAPEWLAELTAPFQDHSAGPAPDVVCGFFQADGRNVFEIALGATTLPDLEDVDPGTFLPSSRSVAFTRGAWERVGGYPEWLDYCEDLVFDLRLRAAGHRGLRPGRPRPPPARPSLLSFFVQYYRYARGDGKADLWRKRHAIRYATYLVGLPGLAALAIVVHPLVWLVLVAGGLAYLWAPYRRLLRRLGPCPLAARLYALALVPVTRLVGDASKMLGYPAGLLW